MNCIIDTMNDVLNKCDIMLDGFVISKERILRLYADFLSQTINKRDHNIGVVWHSGSICFNAFTLAYVAITNLMFNQSDISDVLNSLEPGDVVLFGDNKKKRYKFEGYVRGEEVKLKGDKYIVLSRDDGKEYISEQRWRLIEPYNGSSGKLDGRGIRRRATERDAFYMDVLGVEKNKIPSMIDTTAVLVMPKDEADRLIRGISLKFGAKQVPLLELVTVSYYTEESEYRYGGNAGHNEPVIKLCSKVFVAQRLIRSREGNKHIGLVVMGQDILNNGESELPELISRKSLQYVYLCSNSESDFLRGLLEDEQEAESFACTKTFLKDTDSTEMVVSNRLSEELNKQLKVITDKNYESFVFLERGISPETYTDFKRKMVQLKRNSYESEAKNNFMIHANSLFNLLLTAPFSLRALNNCIRRGLTRVSSVEEKLEGIERIAAELPPTLRTEAHTIVEILRKLSEVFGKSTPKEMKLREYLRNNTNKLLALVVPKAYYATVISDIPGFIPGTSKGVVIMTPGSFDNTRIYDAIIVLGDIEGKKFNAFSCNASKNIIFFLYESEEKFFRSKRIKSVYSQSIWDRHSTIPIKTMTDGIFKEGLVDENSSEDEFVIEMSDDDKEIMDYLSEMETMISSADFYPPSQNGKYNMMSEVIAIARFSDDRKAFFSKNYKAYVLDPKTGIVREESVKNLSEDDCIVFTQNNDDTKDIVDSILKQMLDNGKLSKTLVDDYQRSREWRNSLIDHMQKQGITPKKIAEELKRLNVPVQEVTVINWMDEDTHIVGPKDPESIRAIGILTDNRNLINDTELYFDSCRKVRQIRRRILEEIGKAIIHNVGHSTSKMNNEFSEVYEKIDSLAEVLRIERITSAEMKVPMYAVNRPIDD